MVTRETHEAALLERAGELQAIAGALRGARSESGSLVVVQGPAGIGKTALLEAAGAEAEAQGMAVARAAGFEVTQVALGVALRLLVPLVEAHPDGGALFAGAAGRTRPLFGDGGSGVAAGDAFALVDGLGWLCATLAAERPLLLAVDDVQWADDGSLELLRALAGRVDELPICLVAAVRTGEPAAAEIADELSELSELPAIRLQPLSPDATATIARSYLGDGATGSLCEVCARETGGSPLLLREMLRALRERDLESPADLGALDWVGRESIENLVARRLARCSDQTRTLADALSVLGRGATLDEGAALAGIGRDAAARALAELSEAELVQTDPDPRFRNPLLRRVVYQALGEAERADAHLAAARLLADDGPPERAASHLLGEESVAPIGEPWIVPALTDAARAAAGRGGRREASAYLRRALAEVPGDEQRAALLRELGRIAAQARDPAAIEHLEAALELTGDPLERARVALELGDALFYLVQLEKAASVCRRAAQELGPEDRELALILEAKSLNADRLRGAERERPRRLEPEVAGGNSPGERAVLVHVAAEAVATGERSAEAVQEIARRAWADGRLLQEAGAGAPRVSFLGTTLSWAEDFETTLALSDAELELGWRLGSPIAISYALALRSGTYLRLGDLARAEADAEQVVDALPASDPLAHMISYGWLLEAMVERGRAEEARGALEDRGLTGPVPDVGTADFFLLARGDVARACGDPDAALAEYRAAGVRAERSGYLNPAGLAWRSRAALAQLDRGEREDGRSLAVEEVERARRFGAPRALGIALHALGLCSDEAERVAPLREAVESFDRSEARLQRARARISLGAALGEEGEAEEGRQLLEEGMDAAHHLGGHLLVDRAMDGLRALGARPRRPALRGIDALTPQQRRIAELAAVGNTNREIAEGQFLTKRTVELHLTGAFRKLEISSREELPRILS
ncbi:hypothetical protein BH20ACT15_BH20ACT15_00490 [soil metagenome]